MLIPLIDSACRWQPNADESPEAFSYAHKTGTSRAGGGTMEPADTCIGRALRGRQAPHALAL